MPESRRAIHVNLAAFAVAAVDRLDVAKDDRRALARLSQTPVRLLPLPAAVSALPSEPSS